MRPGAGLFLGGFLTRPPLERRTEPKARLPPSLDPESPSIFSPSRAPPGQRRRHHPADTGARRLDRIQADAWGERW